MNKDDLRGVNKDACGSISSFTSAHLPRQEISESRKLGDQRLSTILSISDTSLLISNLSFESSKIVFLGRFLHSSIAAARARTILLSLSPEEIFAILPNFGEFTASNTASFPFQDMPVVGIPEVSISPSTAAQLQNKTEPYTSQEAREMRDIFLQPCRTE